MIIGDIDRELAFLGDKYIERYPTMGALPPDDEEKVRLGLKYLRDTICPHKEKITATLDSLPAQVVGTVLDMGICMALKIEVPILKLSEIIARIGVAEFCKDPESIRGK